MVSLSIRAFCSRRAIADDTNFFLPRKSCLGMIESILHNNNLTQTGLHRQNVRKNANEFQIHASQHWAEKWHLGQMMFTSIIYLHLNISYCYEWTEQVNSTPNETRKMKIIKSPAPVHLTSTSLNNRQWNLAICSRIRSK